MENFIFFASLGFLALGLVLMTGALFMNSVRPPYFVVRLSGLLATAAAFALMAVAFIVSDVVGGRLLFGDLLLALIAGYFSFDTVRKARVVYWEFDMIRQALKSAGKGGSDSK